MANGRASEFQLTARDADVVRCVYDVRVCRREHLQRLFFGTRNRSHCQSRLTLLYRHRYLDRLPKHCRADADVYYVSRRSTRGISLLRASGIPDPLTLEQLPREKLQHALDITSVRVQTLQACRGGELTLARWLDEDELSGLASEAGFLPDAYLQLARQAGGQERQVAFFVEVERTDKSVRAISEKFERINAYYRGGGHELRFGTRSLRVLYLLGSDYGIRPERKAVRMAELAAAVGATFLCFAPLRDFLVLDPCEVFYTAIWRRPGHDELVPLIQRERLSP